MQPQAGLPHRHLLLQTPRYFVLAAFSAPASWKAAALILSALLPALFSVPTGTHTLHLPLSFRQAEPQSPRSALPLLPAQLPRLKAARQAGLTDSLLSRTGFSVLRTLLSALRTALGLRRSLLFCCSAPRARRQAAPLQYSVPSLFRKAALLRYSTPSASGSVRSLPLKAASFFPLTLFCRMPVLFLSRQAVLFRRKALLLLPQVWLFHSQVHRLFGSASPFRLQVPALSPQ